MRDSSRLTPAIVVAASLALALVAPGSALAHDVSTAAGHRAEDTVLHDAAIEASLNKATRHASAVLSRAAAATVAADPGQAGQWGPVVNWPVVGIHVALLPNGKVLAWDSVGDGATETFPDQTSREPRSTTRPRAHRRRSTWTRATTSSALGSPT